MSVSREVIAILEWVAIHIGNFIDLVGSVFTNSFRPETVEGLVGLFVIAVILRILDGGSRKKIVVVREEDDRNRGRH